MTSDRRLKNAYRLCSLFTKQMMLAQSPDWVRNLSAQSTSPNSVRRLEDALRVHFSCSLIRVHSRDSRALSSSEITARQSRGYTRTAPYGIGQPIDLVNSWGGTS
jgi:hypothetical protein